MARRKRRNGLGAVAKHGSSGPGMGHRTFKVAVEVHRNIGASNKVQYAADACVVRKRWPATPHRTKGHYDTRCGHGAGRTPTAAGKKALRNLSAKLK